MLPTDEPDPPSDVTHLSIFKKQWKYRGEGNANLVLALPEERVILRLHKTRRDTVVTEELEYEELNRVCREAFFCRTVMVPLLGKAYIQPPKVGQMPHKEIHQLDQLLWSQRPEYRHHKGISLGYVNIYPDYALLPERLTQPEPTFCVEIKPKQGWVPRTPSHHHKCTFCLNQYLKLSNGAINRISQYCPLDLFSGDEKRMKKALKSLLVTPQNNLKIFKDGYLVYSDETNADLTHTLLQWIEPTASSANPITVPSLVDRFCSLVQHALTADLLGEDVSHPVLLDKQTCCPLIYPQQSQAEMENIIDQLAPCDLTAHPLQHNCILDRILWIQKLQQYDTETIHNMLWQNGNSNDYNYVLKLWDPDTQSLCLDPVQRYLLATTAKDCSVLITFQRLRNERSVPEQHLVVDPANGERYVFSIGVSDLDPKPLSCVEKHLKRDKDILYAVTNSLNNCNNLPLSDNPNTLIH